MSKVAVVGAGISGLSCAWILSQNHEVHLFESADRLGGHAHTVDVQDSDNKIPIDTGFLVYNELTYPHLTAFFEALGVETVKSDMSLSIKVADKNLEWNGATMNAVFAQRKNLFRPSFYKMLLDILRFDRQAQKNLILSRRHAWTLAELLQEQTYSEEFKNDYLIPMGAAIWSTPEKDMLEFPAATFLTFFINHHLLQVNNRPEWRTVKNGSRNYVQKVSAKLKNIHLNQEVISAERVTGGVKLKTSEKVWDFDKVVFATHAPLTAKILKNLSVEEDRVLKAFSFEENLTALHRDESLMPSTKLCWAAWNVLARPKDSDVKVALTYYINQLQPIQTQNNYFVTLNSPKKIENIIGEYVYHHPQFTQEAIRAQRQLPSIQGVGGVYYAGAWTRYGFHEDGVLSAVQVADFFGIEPPWKIS